MEESNKCMNFKLLSRSDPMSIVLSFFDFESLVHTLMRVNKDFFYWVTSSIETVRFCQNWNQSKCRAMDRVLLRYCTQSLRHFSVKNTYWSGCDFKLSHFPNLTSFRCEDQLQDKSEASLLGDLLLVSKEEPDPNQKLKNLYFNLDNIRPDTLEVVINHLESNSSVYKCRNFDSIIFSNNHTTTRFTPLLFHVLNEGASANNVVKHLELRHFSKINEILVELKGMLSRAQGVKLKVESIRFISCNIFSDESLQCLCDLFDNRYLKALHFEMTNGNISIQSGWNTILPHFSRLIHFSCDSFVLGSNDDASPQYSGTFRSLSYLHELQSLRLSFYKFREELTPSSREKCALYGADFIQTLLPLINLKKLLVTDMGEVLTQEALENGLKQIEYDDMQHNCFQSLSTLKLCNAKIKSLDPLFKLIHENIEDLQIEYCCNVERMAEHPEQIGYFHKLRTLNLMRMKYLSRGTIGFLADRMGDIRSLSLSNCESIPDLCRIGELKHLRQLNLTGLKRICDDDLKFLSPLKNLYDLNMTSLKNLKGYGFRHLLKECNEGTYESVLPELRVVRMDWCKNLCDEFLINIQWFSSIEHLSLIHSVRLERFEHLGKLTNLRHLSLTRVPLITDESLASIISQTHNLLSLHINGGYQKLNQALTNESLKQISSLKMLRSLELNFCGHNLTDEGLCYLQPLKYQLIACNFLRCPGLKKRALTLALPHTSVCKESDPAKQSWKEIVQGIGKWILMFFFFVHMLIGKCLHFFGLDQ